MAIVSRSADPDADVDYLFGQVRIDEPVVDYRGNCGNMLAGVGPFAIDEGLVDAAEPITRVRIRNVNTGRLVTAEVPVTGGRARASGDAAIAGVPAAAPGSCSTSPPPVARWAGVCSRPGPRASSSTSPTATP